MNSVLSWSSFKRWHIRGGTAFTAHASLVRIHQTTRAQASSLHHCTATLVFKTRTKLSQRSWDPPSVMWKLCGCVICSQFCFLFIVSVMKVNLVPVISWPLNINFMSTCTFIMGHYHYCYFYYYRSSNSDWLKFPVPASYHFFQREYVCLHN